MTSNRRRILRSALALPLLPKMFAQTETPAGRPEFFELRWFYLRNGSHAPRMLDLLRTAWAPAAKRVGIGPLGFFQATIGDLAPSVLMLSAFSSAGDAVGAFDRLMGDSEFAPAYARAQSPEPAFVRMDATLLRAFEGTTLTPPAPLPGNAARIFELRTYESGSMLSLRKKLQMFNSGESAIFRRLGMNPVFFGEGIFGRNLPSLTYMLSFADMAARDRLWKEFADDPEFVKLRNQPGYSDAEIVSTISNSILHPLAFSPIR